MSSIYRNESVLRNSDSNLANLIKIPITDAILATGDSVLDAYFSEPITSNEEFYRSEPAPSDYKNGESLITGDPETLGYRWATLKMLDYLGWEYGKQLLNCDQVWNRQRYAQEWFKRLPYRFSSEDALFLMNFHACRFPSGYGQWTLAPWYDFTHIVERSSVEQHPAFLETIQRLFRLADANPRTHYYEGTKLLLKRCCQLLNVDFANTNFSKIESGAETFVERRRERCIRDSGQFFKRLLAEEPNGTAHCNANYDRHLASYYDLLPHDAGTFLLDVVRCDTARREIEVESREHGFKVDEFCNFGRLPPMFTNIFRRMETDLQRRSLRFSADQAIELLGYAHLYPWRDYLELGSMKAILKALDPSDPKHTDCVQSFRDAQFGDDLLARMRAHLTEYFLGQRILPFNLSILRLSLFTNLNRAYEYFEKKFTYK